MLKIDDGDEVQINGWLVIVSLPNGDTARSSLTRTDSGDGGCEIIWVESIKVH